MSGRSAIGQVLHEYFPFVESQDPVSYFHQAGDAAEALKYARLYWPALVEHYGAVFLALNENDEVEIGERLTSPVGDRHPEWRPMSWKEIVDSYNTIEIAHLFGRLRDPVESLDCVYRELGETLIRAWRFRLLEEYPERVFSVRLVEPDEDWPEFRIEVRQESPALEVPQGWNERRRAIEGVADPDIRRNVTN